MRVITKSLLLMNGLLLLFVVLWLLIGGSRGGASGYYGGGAATEVDGVLLLFLAAFNVSFLLAVFLVLPSGAAAAENLARDVLQEEAVLKEVRFRGLLRGWSSWALIVNGIVFLFVGLWLLMNSERWGYFRSNATSVDLVVLFVLVILNILYLLAAYLRFSRPVKAEPTRTAQLS